MILSTDLMDSESRAIKITQTTTQRQEEQRK